ncbi:conserved Plasmodium protein, unknown function [Plasmodium berghei]|uniref:rRNA-processing protein, putative n=2 Tax=Plasmodium berghei TaxID=5821 RepID=A0A509B0T1_PLABA|nr:rRNA-processing protein, putative [Plasmodium berghei ANKA]CXJ22778.1 conserved Plasmodium protein, unknown function [Plasmodium berghei]SCM26682.1 conserved Plasmodium protein, unknown function [Plasmodium berghei]SCN28583.1 conserved Plasmodium protein, unknown function [Plasmodium berghei]SCO62771.1 conserved Plasmodium protein, unknown function [Plasmodium berghei]SCO64331.1 conserved Plasmodium protein, unknown function [Plasmodium berghei]|eukprot:XP_034424227.1 rRNA-processing protein, putative [Plasmodium berghei ANKA]
MKKKVFLNKHHIKNKNFQRKKQKYFTDKKFLRKFKKIKELNETKTEIVKTDPIKNFFFTPITEGDIKEQEQNENSERNAYRRVKTSNKLESCDNKSDEEDENDERNINSKYNNIKKKGGKTDIYRKELSLIEQNKQGQLSKEEKEALFLKKKQEKDEKKKIRFQKFKRLNQKTKKGQPVMKNLIKHLIKKI